ncbi:MAG: choice-of-anchor D domain-containing protein [Chloroflexi bacterium]|nr:choice-of-anchor D domain-containing protein [Chloroflexota bacterium]
MRLLRTLLLLVFCLAVLLAPGQVLRAATFVITTDEDTDDGLCDTNHCTLREAVAAAESSPGPDTISFNIDSAEAPFVIQLTSTLTIDSPVTIDGSTQTGWVNDPIILIDGSLTTATDGLVLTGGSTISNLIIGGFDGAGIKIHTGGGNLIENNFIGFGVDTVTPLANGDGINVQSDSNQIRANHIANNTGAGVYVAGTAANNSILNNFIFDNGGLGIDLDPAGVTPNDAGDADTGPNGLQNFPVITDATPTMVMGTFNSTTGSAFRLQFFSSTTCAAPDAEGEAFVDEIIITTDSNGNASFSAPLSVSVGQFVTATATGDPLPGSTSEFSACVQVVDAPIYSSNPAPEPDPASALTLTTTEGTSANATITVSNLGSAALDITDVVLSNTTDFTLLSSPTFSIAPGGSAVDLDIQCDADLGTSGTFTTDITVTHNDSARSPARYTLSCTVNALPVPQFESSPPPSPPGVTWDAPFGGSAIFTLNLRNVGDVGSTLTVDGTLTDTNNPRIFDVVGGDTFNFGISGGGSRDVQLRCQPRALITYTATLTLTTNDPDTADQTVTYNLSCTGTQPPGTDYVSTPAPGNPINFATTVVGTAVTADLEIQNAGTAILFVSEPTGGYFSGAHAADFSFVNGTQPPIPVAPSDSWTIRIQCLPSAAGTRTATLTLQTNDPVEPTPSYPLNCPATLLLNPATLPDGTVSVVYPNQTITATGGSGTYTFAVTTGALPPGLNLAADGVLSGTPTQEGTYPFTVTATDTSDGTITGRRDYTIVINPPAPIYTSVPAPAPDPASTISLTTTRGTPVSTSIVVTNTGTAQLDITDIALSDTTNFTVITSPPINIAPNNGTGTITVQCNATTAGPQTTTITVTHNASGSPGVYTFNCTVNAPVYTSSPAPAPDSASTISLPTTQGTPVSTLIVVTNTGTAQLDITAITLTDSSNFTVTTPPPINIAPNNGTGTITVQCNATTASGTPFTTNITVAHNAAGSPAVYTLNCTVNAPPSQPGYDSVPPPGGTIDFGSSQVGTPITNNTLTISETGNAALTISNPSITGANATDFSVTAPSFPITINDGGATQAVTLRCNPSATGLRTANLTFTTNDPARPNPSYTLQCTGTAAPAPSYQSVPAPGSTIDLGSSTVGTSITVDALTISETGTLPLTVSNPTITGANAAEFSITAPASFPFTINDGGAPQVVSIRCTPGGAGLRQATLTLTTNDPTQTAVSYTLQCTGTTAPTINLSPPSLPSGTVGVRYNQTVTATGGTGPYTLTQTGTLPPGISFIPSTPSATLSGTPTSAGSFTFTVTATDAIGATGSQNYTLVIAPSTPPSQPIYTSFPTPGGFITLNTTPNAQVNGNIIISNTGTAVLRISSIALSNPVNFALLTPAAFDVAAGTSQTATIRCLSPVVGTFLTAVVVSHNASGSPASYTIVCNVTTTLLPTATPIGTLPGTLAPTAIPPTPTPAAPSTGAVNNEVKGQALRTGPYLGATLIGEVLSGQQYPILARSRDEGGEFAWYLIRVGNVTGWTSGRFFKFTGNPDLLPTAGSIFDQIDNAPDTGMTTTLPAMTDMRRRPSGRAAIIRTLPQGAVVSVIGRTRQNGGNYWLHVRYEGQVGWIPAYVENSRGNWENVPIR